MLASSFLGTLVLTPFALRRLRGRGFIVEDRYKREKGPLVTHAGLLGLGAAMAALAATFAWRAPSPLFSVWPTGIPDPILSAQLGLFTIGGYGIVGAIDDRRSLSHLVKAAVPLTLGVPAAVLVLARSYSLPFLPAFGANEALAGAAVLLVVPLYVLVVTNLVNMHSGFNGLQSGLSLILLGAILVRVAFEGTLEQNVAVLVVAGSAAAFYPFNRFPAKAIEGNVGSFLVGAAIGVGITTNGLFLPGAVMLAPHILDFLLFAYAKATGRPFIKFGALRSDGTIEAPYPFKLKFLLPYYFRLNERQTVRWLYALTVAACVVSFAVPR